ERLEDRVEQPRQQADRICLDRGGRDDQRGGRGGGRGRDRRRRRGARGERGGGLPGAAGGRRLGDRLAGADDEREREEAAREQRQSTERAWARRCHRTGSNPPGWPGWQRAIRFAPIHEPRKMPYLSIACSV